MSGHGVSAMEAAKKNQIKNTVVVVVTIVSLCAHNVQGSSTNNEIVRMNQFYLFIATTLQEHTEEN